jgi:hypothetical protein
VDLISFKPTALPQADEALLMRKGVLFEAHELVNGERAESYGDAQTNFARWRDMCQATGRIGLVGISAEDLVVVMIMLKLSRDTNKPKRDNCVDGAAYFELLDRVRGL